MTLIRLGRSAIGLGAAILAACGGSAPSVSPVPITAADAARGRVAVLYNFAGPPDAAGPVGGLLPDKNGNLFGTTYDGGVYSGCGTIDGCGAAFELSPSQSGYTERVIWSFGGAGDGQHPGSGSELVEDASGALYGTTLEGGANNEGAAFKLTPSGSGYTEKVIYSFCSRRNCTDGQAPSSGLTLDRRGVLYGTTSGVPNPKLYGNVFRLRPSGSNYVESVIWNFSGSDGQFPDRTLIEDSSGALYGTTSGGGAYNAGTVFKLIHYGKKYKEQILLAFNESLAGPLASGLFEDKNGALYGTALYGGMNTCNSAFSCGSAFKLTPTGTSYAASRIWDFDNNNGYWPNSGLIEAKDGSLYGTTTVGGPNVCEASVQRDCGRVFKLTPAGSGYVEHIIWNFDGKDGYGPGVLVVGPSGDLYGTTYWGGTKSCVVDTGCGAIFKVSVH